MLTASDLRHSSMPIGRSTTAFAYLKLKASGGEPLCAHGTAERIHSSQSHVYTAFSSAQITGPAAPQPGVKADWETIPVDHSDETLPEEGVRGAFESGAAVV